MPTYALTINGTGGTIGGSGVMSATILDFTGGVFSATDGSNTLQTTSNLAAQTTGFISTSVNGDIVVGGLSGPINSGTNGTGWTLGILPSGTSGSGDEYQIQSTSGGINPTFASLSPTGNFMCGVTGAFKKSSGTFSFSQKAGNGAGVASVTVTLASQPAAGDVIVVLAYTGSWSTLNTGFSVNTDAFGNTYTLLVQNLYTAGKVAACIFYLGNFKTSNFAGGTSMPPFFIGSKSG